MRVSIVILTYQSVHHLRDLLPSLAPALAKERVTAEVLVVENSRDPASERFMKEQFPMFRHAYAAANDYLFSLNPVIEELESDYVVILNDDMAVEDGGLDRAVALLEEHPDLFAVNLRMTDWEGKDDQFAVRDLQYRNGFYTSRWRPDLNGAVRYTLYAGGGSGLFRRSMFVALGGFSRLYFPAYAEDMDLGWRAWHRGWPSVYLPDSWIRHKEGGTLEEQMPTSRRTRQIYANRIVCMLRNGNMPGFHAEFLLRLPYRLLVGSRHGGHHAVALTRAMRKYGEVMKARNGDPEPVLRDEEIMARIGETV